MFSAGNWLFSVTPADAPTSDATLPTEPSLSHNLSHKVVKAQQPPSPDVQRSAPLDDDDQDQDQDDDQPTPAMTDSEPIRQQQQQQPLSPSPPATGAHLVAPEQAIDWHRRWVLERERRVQMEAMVERLQMELETVPLYIERYHDERKRLKQKAAQKDQYLQQVVQQYHQLEQQCLKLQQQLYDVTHHHGHHHDHSGSLAVEDSGVAIGMSPHDLPPAGHDEEQQMYNHDDEEEFIADHQEEGSVSLYDEGQGIHSPDVREQYDDNDDEPVHMQTSPNTHATKLTVATATPTTAASHPSAEAIQELLKQQSSVDELMAEYSQLDFPGCAGCKGTRVDI